MPRLLGIAKVAHINARNKLKLCWDNSLKIITTISFWMKRILCRFYSDSSYRVFLKHDIRATINFAISLLVTHLSHHGYVNALPRPKAKSMYYIFYILRTRVHIYTNTKITQHILPIYKRPGTMHSFERLCGEKQILKYRCVPSSRNQTWATLLYRMVNRKEKDINKWIYIYI